MWKLRHRNLQAERLCHWTRAEERGTLEGDPVQDCFLSTYAKYISVGVVFWTNSGMYSVMQVEYRESCDIRCLLSFLFHRFSTCWEFRACRTGMWVVGILLMFFLYTFAVLDTAHLFSALWGTGGQVRVYCRSMWCLLFLWVNSQAALSFPT